MSSEEDDHGYDRDHDEHDDEQQNDQPGHVVPFLTESMLSRHDLTILVAALLSGVTLMAAAVLIVLGSARSDSWAVVVGSVLIVIVFVAFCWTVERVNETPQGHEAVMN